MLRCGDKFYNWSTMGSLVPQQAHQFWSRRQKGTKIQILKHNKFFKKILVQVPESCCLLDANSLKVDCQSDNPVDTSKIYTSDCFAAALIFVKGHSIVVGGVAVGIAAIMVRKKSHLFKIQICCIVWCIFLSTDSSSSRKGFSRATGTT